MILSRCVIAFSILSTVMPASAQPTGPQADELYNRGRALVAVNKTAEACAAFEQSQKLDPVVSTLIALAICREMLGQLATAWELFLEAERQSRSGTDDKTVQLHKIALDRAVKVEPRVPKLTIKVPDKSKIDRLEILLDQEVIPAENWNHALPIDGGTYLITARALGVNDWSTRVTITNTSGFKVVDIPDLRSLRQTLGERSKSPAAIEPATERRQMTPESAPATAEQLAKVPEPAETSRRRGSTLPISVSAGAVALFGGALGFSRWSNSTYDDAKAEIMDQARRDSLEASANRKTYVAQGLAVAGISCAGVAVWLYFRQRGTRSATTLARAAHLILAPTASGIGLIGRF